MRFTTTVELGGHTCRSTVARRDGRYPLPLSAENRAAAGVAAGDRVDVEVELDTAPRTVEMPADLAAALDADPGAREHFDALPHTHRTEHVLAVESAKAAETRQRRVSGVLAALRKA